MAIFFYQAKTQPVSTSPEAVTVDRFAPTYPQPKRPLLSAALAATMWVGPVFVSTAPTVTPTDWIQQHPQPSRAAKPIERSFAVSVLTTAGETIRPDKWLPTWNQPRRDPRYATGTTSVGFEAVASLPVSMGFLPTYVQPKRTPRPLDGSFVVLVSAIAAADPGHGPYRFFVRVEDSSGDWADTKIEIA